MALLMLTYGGRMEKTQEACCMVEQEGLSFRKAERVVETNLFLDEYPQWNIGSPHQSCYLTQDVLACGIMRAERGGTYVPLGLPR